MKSLFVYRVKRDLCLNFWKTLSSLWTSVDVVHRLTSIQLMRFLCTYWPQYSWCATCVQIDLNAADALLVNILTSIQLMRFLCTDWPQCSWCATCVQIDLNAADALLVYILTSIQLMRFLCNFTLLNILHLKRFKNSKENFYFLPILENEY